MYVYLASDFILWGKKWESALVDLSASTVQCDEKNKRLLEVLRTVSLYLLFQVYPLKILLVKT